MPNLPAHLEMDALARGFTRRHLGRLAAVVTASASLPFYNEAALAQRAAGRRGYAPGAVRISSNENPLGPCDEAVAAIAEVARLGGRYSPRSEHSDFIEAAAKMEGVKPEYITAYAGSSDPLHRSVCAFVSPTKGLVAANPGYEAAARTAEFVGAPVQRVPLRADYSHDVKAMLKADPNAGVYYICNPNNPSGTMTSPADIAYLLKNKPKGSILLLDEAYIHFSGEPTGIEHVKNDEDVVILRTFSKLYGMAGLRAGMAIGRPDLIAKLRPYGSGMLPITGLVGATASMNKAGLVKERAKINADVRDDVLAFLKQKDYKYVPSKSNKFMLEVGQPGDDFRKKMAQHNVYVGRTWPVWPTWSRVTVGTAEEMDKFKEALTAVMS